VVGVAYKMTGGPLEIIVFVYQISVGRRGGTANVSES